VNITEANATQSLLRTIADTLPLLDTADEEQLHEDAVFLADRSWNALVAGLDGRRWLARRLNHLKTKALP